MINKQDSYWTEYTLDEKVDQKVCVYLREHHAEYRNTKQKMKELMEQYPNVQSKGQGTVLCPKRTRDDP